MIEAQCVPCCVALSPGSQPAWSGQLAVKAVSAPEVVGRWEFAAGVSELELLHLRLSAGHFRTLIRGRSCDRIMDFMDHCSR